MTDVLLLAVRRVQSFAKELVNKSVLMAHVLRSVPVPFRNIAWLASCDGNEGPECERPDSGEANVVHNVIRCELDAMHLVSEVVHDF